MKDYYFYCFLIFLTILIGGVHSWTIGGTCEQLNPNSLCSGLEYKNIYIPEGSTQEELEAEVAGISGAIDFAESACKPYLSLLYCLAMFQKCNTINDTTPVINLPSFPCNSICEKTRGICSNFFDNFFPDFSCSVKNTDNQDSYPLNSTIYDLSTWGGSSDQNISCNSGGDTKITVDTGCAKPLVYVDKEKRKDNIYYFVNPECAIPCPFKVYTEEQYDRMRITKIITYALSFTSSVYLIFVFGILPNKVTHRMETILSFAIGGFLVSLAYYMEFGGSKEYDDFICSDDPGRYIFETDVKCGFNGVFFHFGLLTSVIWWTMICLDFYLTMNIQRNLYFKQLRVIAWGTAVLCTVIPLAGQKFGASVGSSGCWIIAGNKTAWPFVSFYIPIWLCIISSFYFLTISMKKIFQTYKIVKNKKAILFNIRTMGFMIWVLFAITFGCFNNFYLDSKSSLFLQQIYDYFYCLTENKDDTVCSVSFPFGTFRLLNIIATSTTGVAGFLGLGLDPIVKTLWLESTKVNYLVQVLKRSHFYSYIMLKGSNNLTASTNTSSYGNTGTNLTSTFSTLKEQTPKSPNRKSTKLSKKSINLTQNPENNEIELNILTPNSPNVNSIDDENNNNNNIDNINNINNINNNNIINNQNNPQLDITNINDINNENTQVNEIQPEIINITIHENNNTVLGIINIDDNINNNNNTTQVNIGESDSNKIDENQLIEEDSSSDELSETN